MYTYSLEYNIYSQQGKNLFDLSLLPLQFFQCQRILFCDKTSVMNDFQ